MAEGTDKLPEGVTEWLGYGATIKVKFGGKWCMGTVIGREPYGPVREWDRGPPRPAQKGV